MNRTIIKHQTSAMNKFTLAVKLTSILSEVEVRNICGFDFAFDAAASQAPSDNRHGAKIQSRKLFVTFLFFSCYWH